ncbi:ribbon-helix-helix protein, CopG family [Thiogranum longum]
MSTTTQVSAYISEETKAEIEAYVKRRGVKKAYLIEEALQHHLQALREIPEDLIIPSRLVLTAEAMAQIAECMTQEEQPTEALKALFRD